MKSLILRFIYFYRRRVSPHKKSCCRFRPTCSGYAIRAVERYGAFRGLLMAVCRLLRCNPLFRGGYDPVPEHFTLRSGVGKYREPSVCDTCEYQSCCDGESCENMPQNKGV